MKNEHMNNKVDICLLVTSEITMGARSLSSFLKLKDCTVALGFFDSWGLYTKKEIANIVGWIREMDPGLIGVSSIEFTREKTIQLIAALKKEGRVIVAGGVDATLNPAYYLNYADLVIRGEGENALKELIDAGPLSDAIKHLPNLCYLNEQGVVIKNKVRPLQQNLDDLPCDDWLDYTNHYVLKNETVTVKNKFTLDVFDQTSDRAVPGIYMCTMRGCSLECSFCINYDLNQLNPGETHIRKRSIESVVARVEQLKKADSHLSIVYFFDDDFFLRTIDEIEYFSIAWKQRVGLPFYVNCTPITLHEGKLRFLLDAGLMLMTMGIQSGSERINHDVYCRNVAKGSVPKAAQLLGRFIGQGTFGLLPPSYDFIINNPYESRKDLLQTIRLVEQLPKPYCAQMHSLKLFQGTKLYRQAICDGMLSGKDELTKFNCHDTLNHFDALVRRGGDYYLNSLLYWMNGNHSDRIYGIVPAKMIGFLTRDATITFFNRNRRLVSFLNALLPTRKRIFNAQQKIRKYFVGRST